MTLDIAKYVCFVCGHDTDMCLTYENTTDVCAECIREAISVICEALKELAWYRGQDLIRREDVDNILCGEPIISVDGTYYGTTNPSIDTLKDRLAYIPKAEPPKE